MNNGQIFDFVSTILRKEKSGSAITPQRFTLMLIESMWEKVNFEYASYEESQVVTDTLRSLKVSQSISVSGSGEIDLTTLTYDYFHPSGLTYTYLTNVRDIEIVTDSQWNYRLSNSLLAPSNEYPIAKFIGDTLKFNPIVSASVTFNYLKKPQEPFYDYYYDANNRIVYLEEGESYVLQTGEEYRDGTLPPATVNSISIELPFPDNERIDIVYKILQKLGVTLQDSLSVQFGKERETKEEAL